MSSDISTYNFPTKIRFGPGSRHELTAELSALGIQRPLIVTDRDVVKLPWFSTIENAITSIPATTFSGVWGNPVVSQVMAGLTAYQQHNIDIPPSLGSIGISTAIVGKLVSIARHQRWLSSPLTQDQ